MLPSCKVFKLSNFPIQSQTIKSFKFELLKTILTYKFIKAFLTKAKCFRRESNKAYYKDLF